jgi:tryptophan synthase alpha chain
MALSFPKKPSLVAYVTCGDPNLAITREIVLAALDAGADVIELGVPFSDPVADGPVIQRASERALRQGTTLGDVLELARQVRRESKAGLILFSYFNPVLRLGIGRFSRAMADAGLDGALITDLPTEEAHGYIDEMRSRDLATVFLAAPTSTTARLRQIAKLSTGFIYAVSRTGTTGEQAQMPEDAPRLVGRIRKLTAVPVAVGFGISTGQQFRGVGRFADAAVVGSALVATVERNPGKEASSVAQFIAQLLGKNGPAGEIGKN